MARPTILIIGAGPVGLTLALSLHHAGVPPDAILVADQRASCTPTTLSKALSMNASSLEVFRALGIANRFLAAGVPIHKAHFGGGARLLDLDYEVLGTKYPFNYAIPQRQTEEILLARCDAVGIQFAWGRQLVALEDVGEAVVATLEKTDGESETISTPWIVGCDGTRSAVRNAAHISWTGTRATNYCWGVDCAVDLEVSGLMTGSDAGGRTLMYPLGNGQVRFVGNIPPSEIVAGQRPTAPSKADLSEWARRTFGCDFGVGEISWSSVLGDGMSVAGTLRAGRVFVAGDAAHQLFPAGGQGMNTGLLDVANLAWKLAMVATDRIVCQAAVERVLDSYTSERKPAIEAVVKNVRAQVVSMFSTGENEQAVAEFISEALDQPALNRLWAIRVTGFGDPTEPYQHGSQRGDGLVGTRLTHVADAHADDVLQAASDNIFLLATVHAGSGEPVDLDWAEHLLTKHKGKVRALDSPLEATAQKWAGVKAVLLRPDLRIAWVLRDGSSPDVRLETLSSILSWWFGEPTAE